MQSTSPLFIVGMPRSGTKLIRDLLNTHPRISIPEAESHFIPYFCRKYGMSPDFANPRNVNQFIADFEQSTFYINTTRAGIKYDRGMLLEVVKSCSWAEILKFILLAAGPTPEAQVEIWGDKTPGYINHLELLSAIYPNARFLHIVRDPRDYARSVQICWGKNPFRAAVAWQKVMTGVQHQSPLSANTFLEIQYENLLREPGATLQDVLEFLNLEPEPGFGTLLKPTENIGDAKGATEVVTHNTGKYCQYFTPRQVSLIEQICAPGMRSHQYKPDHCSDSLVPSRIALLWWKLQDGLTSIHFHIREKGWRTGVFYFLQFHSRSSWREY